MKILPLIHLKPLVCCINLYAVACAVWSNAVVAQDLAVSPVRSIEPIELVEDRNLKDAVDQLGFIHDSTEVSIADDRFTDPGLKSTQLCGVQDDLGGTQLYAVKTTPLIHQVQCETFKHFITGNPANATGNITISLAVKDDCPYTPSAVFYLDSNGKRLGDWTIPADGTFKRNQVVLRPGDYLELDCYGDQYGRGCQFLWQKVLMTQ